MKNSIITNPAFLAKEATTFAHPHKISVAVAKAILLNAPVIEDADRAAQKSAGTRIRKITAWIAVISMAVGTKNGSALRPEPLK